VGAGFGDAQCAHAAQETLVSTLFDTGVLLDYLAGLPAARETLDRYPNSAISVVTWVELMTLAPRTKEESTRNFLRRFERLALNEAIADRAAQVARAYPSVPLSFAMTYATARINTLQLLTVDPPEALRSEPGIDIPYTR
jgi:predicted nucleic acid-binding protein